MKSVSLGVLVWCALGVHPLWAEASDPAVAELRIEVQRLGAVVQELHHTVQTQAARIQELERQQPQVAQAAFPQATRVAALEQQGLGSLSGFNPEIGVLADVVGELSESSAEGEGNDKLSVRELELIFGHPIDPYARLDTTITFSDFEEPTIEEAYLTHWGLPAGITARAGRLRPKIGKATAVHRDQLETTDEPLVVRRYLGNEGLFRTGLELSGFLPVPWTAVTHELTAGLMEGGVGEGGALFGTTRRRPSAYSHLKNFWEISDTSNVELGVTSLVGSRDADARSEVNAVGFDATLVHYVTPSNKLKWLNELYWQDRDEAFSLAADGTRTEFNDQPWGWYSLLDYRLSPRFGLGGRFDYVEPVDADPAMLARQFDSAWSGYLTFYQSEFARWRLQVRHTDFALGGDDNSVFLQGTVAIGVHRHQLQ